MSAHCALAFAAPRQAEPEDISDVMVYLLSENAGMVNGTILPIDGGFLSSRATI